MSLADPQTYGPAIIDVEAAGFGSGGYPVEIGVALPDGSTYCSLVLPLPDWTYWDEEAEKVHRIPRDILEAYGKPIPEVAAKLNSLLQDQVAYSDGWEVDKPWVSQLFHAAGLSQLFRFSSIEFILNDAQMRSWHAAKDDVLREMTKKRHRASFDALVIQKTWLRTRNGG